MNTEGNGTNGEKLVGYSVKELLADLNRKIDIIDGKLDRKADTKEVDALIIRMTATELRLTTMEAISKTKENTFALWLPLIFSVATSIGLAGLNVYLIVHH
jgi:hypothetical protein